MIDARVVPGGCDTAGIAVERLGDAAVLLRFGNGIDASINRCVHACAAALVAKSPDWLTELTPAYASLALHVDIARICNVDPFGSDSFDGDLLGAAIAWITQWLAHASFTATDTDARIIEIPVAYGGEHGPDLTLLATHAGIAVEDVVARHTAAEYTVAMLGFAPGFPYLLGLDPALAMPRLPSPRTRVMAGSIGIGGAQTGIYPQPGPGGWRLIGRTPLSLFDAQRDPPSLLRAGDRVHFVAIDAAAFDALAEHTR